MLEVLTGVCAGMSIEFTGAEAFVLPLQFLIHKCLCVCVYLLYHEKQFEIADLSQNVLQQAC